MSGGAASKRKGSAFERHVCSSLSLWISGGKADDWLWRSAMSGGRGTRRELKHGAQQVSGDICAVAPGGHRLTDWYHIEAKHVKDMNLTGFVLKGTGFIANAWHRCVRQSFHHRKIPMLIIRQNLMPDIAILQTDRHNAPLLYSFTHSCWVYLLSDVMFTPYTIPRLPLLDVGAHDA